MTWNNKSKKTERNCMELKEVRQVIVLQKTIDLIAVRVSYLSNGKTYGF